MRCGEGGCWARRLRLGSDVAAWAPSPACLFISFTCRVSCDLGSSRLPIYAPDKRKIDVLPFL